jgi:hypothetical protein
MCIHSSWFATTRTKQTLTQSAPAAYRARGTVPLTGTPPARSLAAVRPSLANVMPRLETLV